MLGNKIVFRSKKIREWFSDLSNWEYVDKKLFDIIQNGGKIVVVVDYYQHCIDLIRSIIPSEINVVNLNSASRYEISSDRTNMIFGIEKTDLNDRKIKEDINLALYPYRNTLIICEEEVFGKLKENIDYRNLFHDFTKLKIEDPVALIRRLKPYHITTIQGQDLPFVQFLCTLDSCFYIWERFDLEKRGFNFRDYINNIWELLDDCVFTIDEEHIIWHIMKGEEKEYCSFLRRIFSKNHVKHLEKLGLSTLKGDLKKLIMLYSCVMLNFLEIRNSEIILTPLARELMTEERRFVQRPLIFGWERFLLNTVNRHDTRSFRSIMPFQGWTEHISRVEKIIEEINKQDIRISVPYHFMRLKMATLAILASRAFESTRIPIDYLGTAGDRDKLWKQCNEPGEKLIQNYVNSLKCITELLLNEEKLRTELVGFVKSNYNELRENILICSPILNGYIEKNADKDLGIYLDYQYYLQIFIKEEFVDEIKERLSRDIGKRELQPTLKEFARILDIYGKFLYVIQATSKANTEELVRYMNSDIVKEFSVKVEERISSHKTLRMVNNTKKSLDLVIEEINYLTDFYGLTIKKPFSVLFDVAKLAEIMEDLYGVYEKDRITPDLVTKLFCYYNNFSQEESKISDFLVKFYRVMNEKIVNQYPMSDKLWNVTQIRQFIHYLLGEKVDVPEEIKVLNPSRIVVFLIMDALSYQDWIGIHTDLKPIVEKPVLTTFPTETAPCHMSISVGDFPNEHGVVSNIFIDKKKPIDEIILIGERKGEEYVSKKKTTFSTLTEQRIWTSDSTNYILSPFPSNTRFSQLFRGKYSADFISSDRFGNEEQRLNKLETMLKENLENIHEKGENIRILALILHSRIDKKGHSVIDKDETRMSHRASILAHICAYIEALLKSIESLIKETPLKAFLVVTGDHGRIRNEDLVKLGGIEQAKVDENLMYNLRDEYGSTKSGSLTYRYLQRMRSFLIYSLNSVDPSENIPSSISEENWWILRKEDISRTLGKKSSRYRPDLILFPKYQTFRPIEHATHGGFSLHEIFVPLLIFEIGGD